MSHLYSYHRNGIALRERNHLATRAPAIAVVLVALLTSCSSSDNTINYEDSPQVITSVSVSPTNPRVGEIIEIKIMHENVGTREIDLRFESGGGAGFRIFRDEKQITPKYIKPVQAVSQMILRPGEPITFTKEFALKNNYDQKADRTGPVKFYRGVYEVQAGIIGYSDKYPWGTANFTIRQ